MNRTSSVGNVGVTSLSNITNTFSKVLNTGYIHIDYFEMSAFSSKGLCSFFYQQTDEKIEQIGTFVETRVFI